jgi:hypothetical protein
MSLTAPDALAVFAAAFGAGAINSIAGAGSLITFPTLLATGYGSVIANVSNNIGLVPGSFAGAWGYRSELAGQWHRVRALVPWGALGGATGGVLLLALPSGSFRAVVPGLVLLAGLLVLAQPYLRALVARRTSDSDPAIHVGLFTYLGVFASAMYGGYFGAAQGVLLLGILGIGLPVTLYQANALKNVITLTINAVAAVYFMFAADVAWTAVGIIAAGSILGGIVGSRYGRRVPAGPLRLLIAAIGIGVAVVLLVT